jgi:putative ABC transport system permease protein
MLLYAIKMLIGDRAKYISIVIGLSFASFIISQQSAIMVGIMKRTYGFVTDTPQPDIWVADPTVQYIDDIKPLKDTDLYRVLSITGVDWAVPLYKGTIQSRLRNGIFQTCIFIGIDDATLIGAPPKMIQGSVLDLRMDDAVIVDKVGAETKLASPPASGRGKRIPLRVGDTMELNDNRAYVAGICEVSRTFQSQPVVYTTYGRATYFVPAQRKLLSFILARAKPGHTPKEVCKQITAITGLAAYTKRDFKLLTLKYYARYTGIVVNFGVAILMGFIIGTAVAGQALYNFTLDHLPLFGVFKAMGADNTLLVKMVLLQALLVSGIGWGIGIGAASLFSFLAGRTELSFSMPLYLYLLSVTSILAISLLAAFFSMKKIIKLDPAIVFKS